MGRKSSRRLRLEQLEGRQLMAADVGDWSPMDVNRDGTVSAVDALTVINYVNGSSQTASEMGESLGMTVQELAELAARADVSGDGRATALDALMIINHLNAAGEPVAPAVNVFAAPKAPLVNGADIQLNYAEQLGPQNLLTEADVQKLLDRASAVTPSRDAIIAIVDRSGRILGVRVEDGVSPNLTAPGAEGRLAFAIDGAVAKARTAAFFSNNEAPLTSRTIRFISQSTITQREVESSPLHADPRYQGPGFVAPIGVGGHFPPEIPFTPPVDLFAIEHQSRDSQTHPGADGLRGQGGDDFELQTRFNANPAFIPTLAEPFFKTWPESYGEQAHTSPNATPRGIGTLPGGVPLYKMVRDSAGNVAKPIPNLVGGIGVFFPGEDGFATFEQGFVHGIGQTERSRVNAPKVLEAETIALIASAGGGIISPMAAFGRDLSRFNAPLPACPDIVQLAGRIDLVGLTLEIFGPTPTPEFRQPGIDRLIQLADQLGPGTVNGTNQRVRQDGVTTLAGQAVPEGWLVVPHDSAEPGGLKAADVLKIILDGIATADQTRAAIRLKLESGGVPGARTKMVLAVSDTNGEILGLYRMPDATIFSIDVAVAKSRNTAYYADHDALVEADRVDYDGDGVRVGSSTSLDNSSGDSIPRGTALTNRSFRFLALPRFPSGTELDNFLEIGPQSMLRLPGIDPQTGENRVNSNPLPRIAYANVNHSSTVAYSSFNVMRNFRDPGDDTVRVYGTNLQRNLANQNGVVFFPGSTPLYVGSGLTLVGGFGVSGDGVDQDDVVTVAGQGTFAPDQSIRVDQYVVGGVRIPFQKFNRNPFGR